MLHYATAGYLNTLIQMRSGGFQETGKISEHDLPDYAAPPAKM